jgi:hypothetical protein
MFPQTDNLGELLLYGLAEKPLIMVFAPLWMEQGNSDRHCSQFILLISENKIVESRQI